MIYWPISLSVLRTLLIALQTLGALNQVLNIFKYINNHGVLSYMRNHMSLADWLFAVGIFAIIIAIAILSAGSSEYVYFLSVLAMFSYWAAWYITDENDCDGNWHASYSCNGWGE